MKYKIYINGSIQKQPVMDDFSSVFSTVEFCKCF